MRLQVLIDGEWVLQLDRNGVPLGEDDFELLKGCRWAIRLLDDTGLAVREFHPKESK